GGPVGLPPPPHPRLLPPRGGLFFFRTLVFARFHGRGHHRVRLVPLSEWPGPQRAPVACARPARRRDGDHARPGDPLHGPDSRRGRLGACSTPLGPPPAAPVPRG